jgi:hypothetical protein
MSARVEVDPTQIARFVRLLFRHATPGTFVALRAFAESDHRARPLEAVAEVREGLEEVEERAARIARQVSLAAKAMVFAPPPATFSNRAHAREQDLANGLAISAELDVRPREGLQLLRGILGTPTVVVASGGVYVDPESGEVSDKLHGHWRLSEPTADGADHQRLKLARRLATALADGDPSNVPIVHPMRWPGSIHRKREPRLCRIVEDHEDAEVDLGEALERLEEAAKARGLRIGEGAPGEHQAAQGIDELENLITSGQSYHDPLVKLAARFIARGQNPELVARYLRGLLREVPPDKRDGGTPGRWQARYDDVDRVVASAAKYAPREGELEHGRVVAEALLANMPLGEPEGEAMAEEEIMADGEAEGAGGGTDEGAQGDGSGPAFSDHPPDLEYDAALVLQPQGAVREVMDWITHTAKSPQPMLALGAAVTLIGFLGGHLYRLIHGGNDTRTNIIAIGLAPSGSGKDHPRRCIKAVVDALGLGDFVSENMASGQAIESAFYANFVNLFIVDEYGHRLAAALNQRGNPHERKIVEVITKLATSAAGVFNFTRTASHREVGPGFTYDPHLCLFGTTVEDPLWAAFSSGNVRDGSLARCLLFRTETPRPEPRVGVPHFEADLPRIVGIAESVFTGGLGPLQRALRTNMVRATFTDTGKGGFVRDTPPRPRLLTMAIEEGAKVELGRIEREELALLRAHECHGTDALVARLCEHATRLAMIHAIGRDPKGATVTVPDVLWGEAVAKHSIATVLRAARDCIADTPHEADRNRMLKDLREKIGRSWVKKREVTFATRWANNRQRADLLAELVTMELVERQTVKRGGQSVVEYRCAEGGNAG